MIRSLVVVLTALWAGSLFAIGFVFAPYLFALAAQKSATVPNTGVAADLIGPLLWGADLASLAVGLLVLLGLGLLRWNKQVPLAGRVYLPEAALLVTLLCAAVNLCWLNPAVRAIKAQLAELYGAFHQADRSHPLYTQFNAWHQTSTALFVVGFLAVLVCLICLSHIRTTTACASSTT